MKKKKLGFWHLETLLTVVKEPNWMETQKCCSSYKTNEGPMSRMKLVRINKSSYLGSCALTYILKSLEYSMVDSPSLMQTDPPCWKVCFWSSGSKAGSSDSPTFSNKTGVPN